MMRLAVVPQRNRPLASARRAARAIKSLAVAVLLLLPITAAWPQARGQLTLAQAFDTMKPGQWIRVDGTSQISPTGPTIQSYGLKLMTGDIKENAWSIRGTLRDVDRANRTLKVGSYRIQLVDKPKFSAPVRTIADLKPGMLVKVEGTYQKGAGFLAGKVNDESDVVSRKPGIENRLRVQGKIERVDPAKRIVTMMGTAFVVTDHTQVTSVVVEPKTPTK